MSHEIRTPMTAIIGFSDMLLDDNISPDVRSKVEKVRNSARSLLVILNDILDLSKLEAGKINIENVAFNPGQLAKEVIALFAETCPLEKKGRLNISAKLSSDFPASVFADPTRLRQILINLVGNAVKFTDSGHVFLHCSVVDRQRLRFEISDTGPGIAENTIESIFEAFMQADASISRKYQGTGLGLAICAKLVERLGGKIGVDSEPGVGSVFWFEIPITEVDAPQVLESHEAEHTHEEADRPLSILLVEDNQINQLVVRNILAKFGHQVVVVNNGREALSWISEHTLEKVDLILMDIRMPELSGTDTTRAIRRLQGRGQTIPIIALTADVLEEHQAMYRAVGMNGFVGKPIDPDMLLATIRRLTR